MPFDFLGRIERLSATNLTLREQARLAQNPNDLRWRAIFPRVPVDSVRISEFSTVDFRPVGGRREWNAQGRELPEVLGPQRTWEMVPINPTHHLDERRLQHLRERAANPAGGIVQMLYDGGVIADVDEWATRLADAADRQIERDGFEGWFFNRITVMDPKTGVTVPVSLGISSDRYVQASATLASASNAYRAFLGYLRDARTKLGSVGGVRMRQDLLTEILLDAPAMNGDMATLASLQARINAEGFGNVAIIVDERTYHEFTDGGSAYTTQYYVPTGRMAFQPAGGVVGSTYFAPVTRAWDYVNAAQVRNIRDFTIFYSDQNGGKALLEEAQANALPMPAEQSTYVVYGLS